MPDHPPDYPPDSLLFRDVRVFDGRAVHERTSVLVLDGRIAEITPDPVVPENTTVVDGTGRTLLPGLIDAHVHAMAGSLEQAIRFGVTTELDMFADPVRMRHLRAAAAQRTDIADVRSAGTGATAPKGHPSQMVERGLFGPFPTVASVDDAERFVVARIAEGSDYLKIFASSLPEEPDLPTLSGPMVAALVSAAHDRGMLVVAHATDQAAALRAVRSGVDGLVHLPFDRPMPPSLVDALAESGGFVVPTLTMIESCCQVCAGPALVSDRRITPYLDPDARQNLFRTMGVPSTSGYSVEHARAAIGPLHWLGVPVLAGTDALTPGTAHGVSLHRELELLVAAGLTPVDALAAATSVPARCFRLADRGRIEPGLRADLLLVSGNPTDTITDTRAIVSVYRAGIEVPRSQLSAR